MTSFRRFPRFRSTTETWPKQLKKASNDSNFSNFGSFGNKEIPGLWELLAQKNALGATAREISEGAIGALDSGGLNRSNSCALS